MPRLSSVSAPSLGAVALGLLTLLTACEGNNPRLRKAADSNDAASTGDAQPGPDDAALGAGGTQGTGGVPAGGGVGPFCEVRDLLINQCARCHSPNGPAPDLSPGAIGDIVGQPSAAHPDRVLVVPEDPAASLLYRKLAGTQNPDEGGLMPPGQSLGDVSLALVRGWIAGGASTRCEGGVVPSGDAGPTGQGGGQPPAADATLPTGFGPYCDVVPVFVSRCGACHRPGGDFPDLSSAAALEGLVGLDSRAHPGRALVVPGDPPASLLVRKVLGTQAADEGLRMPIGLDMPPEDQAKVAAWVSAGAPTKCEDPAGIADALPAAIDAGAPADAALPVGTGVFCAAVPMLVRECSGCHRPGGDFPDLSSAGAVAALPGLESDAHPGRALVVAGDTAASLLYRKAAGTQAADEGRAMPPGRALSPASLEALAAWIGGGAPTTCDDPMGIPDAGVIGPYHPVGFDDSAVHGLELKLQVQDCRECHGGTLEGGSGPSCDTCHQAGWRSDCTYCHGGTDTRTGAPPRDLRGTVAVAQLTFRPHTQHESERNHIAWDCNQCHTKPLDVLSAGHVFDDTHGEAEVDFTGGLSPAGTYDGNGGCGNLYCHGDGRDTGDYRHDAARPTCDTCHPTRGLGGRHRDHTGEGIPCTACHGMTVDAPNRISGIAKHVDGRIDFDVSGQGVDYAGGRCSGVCHGEGHDDERW
jgi:hypothetical protein